MRRVVFAVFFFALAPVSISSQQVTLRWKYAAGSELIYRHVTHQETAMPMMGGDAISEQTQTMRWSISEVAPNGDATITITTDHVELETSGPMGSVSYDSRTDSAPTAPEAQVYAAIVGKSYTMIVGTDGTVKSVQGMDSIIHEMMGALPADGREMVQGMLEQMFGEEATAGMMQQNIQIFPQDPVGRGDSWKYSLTLPNPMTGEMTTNLTFAVDGIEEQDGATVAVISSNGDVVVGEGGGGQFAGLMEMDDAEIKGTMYFEVDRGLILSSTTTTSMEMKVSAGVEPMTVETVNTTTMELIDYVSGG